MLQSRSLVRATSLPHEAMEHWRIEEGRRESIRGIQTARPVPCQKSHGIASAASPLGNLLLRSEFGLQPVSPTQSVSDRTGINWMTKILQISAHVACLATVQIDECGQAQRQLPCLD